MHASQPTDIYQFACKMYTNAYDKKSSTKCSLHLLELRKVFELNETNIIMVHWHFMKEKKKETEKATRARIIEFT